MLYRLFILLLPFACFSQKPAEVMLISDNDLYSSYKSDQYYTNGIELVYRYLGNAHNKSIAKKITEFRLGQYIYNPQSVRAADINVNDRPFAGYLFAEAGINTFYKSESVLKANLQAGVVGPESLAEQLQEGLHKLVGYPTVRGWEYQIHTTAALQGIVFYSCKVFNKVFHEKIDFHVQGEVNAGTIWMGAQAGVMARISLKGLLLPMYSSALHGATLSHNKAEYKEKKELFLYFNPMVNYQRYDATIQGSMFSNTSPVTFPLVPFRFIGEAGVKYRKNNWTYSYSFNYRSKELKNRAVTSHYYGSLQLSYLIK